MLKISGLSFGYKNLPLFREASFRVKPTQLIHLSGSNGAGKSTMMAIIAGMLSPSSGSVEYFANESDTTSTEDRRAYLEYLPAEANGLYQKLGAQENLLFWSRLRGVELSEDHITAALECWGLNLPMIRDHFPIEKFSTGMKRKLALARLQLSPAPCWLLDEPFYGLDKSAMEVFQGVLEDHLKNGGMALAVSHEVTPLKHLITKTLPLDDLEHWPQEEEN